jgi:hypothetical protein
MVRACQRLIHSAPICFQYSWFCTRGSDDRT